MKENCLIDKNNEIKINQNNKSFFIIQKSDNWINSIDVKINVKEEIDILNLFLIIKSYIKNIEFYCYRLATVVIK